MPELTDDEVLAILPEEFSQYYEVQMALDSFENFISCKAMKALALALKENAELKEKLESRWSEPFGGQMQSRGATP